MIGIKFVVVLFTVLGLLNVSILETILIHRQKDLQTRKEISHDKDVCVSCKELSLNADENFVNFRPFRIQDNNGEIECCSQVKEVDDIVELLAERKYRLVNSEDGAKKRAIICGQKGEATSGDTSAKLVLRPAPMSGNTSDLLLWDEDSSESYVGPGVFYSDGKISVAENGFYHIYSQVTFVQSASNISFSDSVFKTFCHFIYRHRSGTEPSLDEKLVQAPQTLCETIDENSFGTSAIGSVFYLSSEDQIMIRVSHPERVARSPASVFGLFKV